MRSDPPGVIAGAPSGGQRTRRSVPGEGSCEVPRWIVRIGRDGNAAMVLRSTRSLAVKPRVMPRALVIARAIKSSPTEDFNRLDTVCR